MIIIALALLAAAGAVMILRRTAASPGRDDRGPAPITLGGRLLIVAACALVVLAGAGLLPGERVTHHGPRPIVQVSP